MVGMQSTSFSFSVWLQHNFPRLGKWKSLSSWHFQLLLPPNPWCPEEVNPTPSSTLQITVHSLFSRDRHLILGRNLKEKEEEQEGKSESSRVFAIHQNQCQWTPLYMEQWVTNHHGNVFPHYSINWPGPNQVMWATWAAIYFDTHLLCKGIFNPYWEKKLRITWGRTSER